MNLQNFTTRQKDIEMAVIVDDVVNIYKKGNLI